MDFGIPLSSRLPSGGELGQAFHSIVSWRGPLLYYSRFRKPGTHSNCPEPSPGRRCLRRSSSPPTLALEELPLSSLYDNREVHASPSPSASTPPRMLFLPLRRSFFHFSLCLFLCFLPFLLFSPSCHAKFPGRLKAGLKPQERSRASLPRRRDPPFPAKTPLCPSSSVSGTPEMPIACSHFFLFRSPEI